MRKYHERISKLLSPEKTAEESERAGGIHIESIIYPDKTETPSDDWNAHWTNVHISSAYYIREYIWQKKELERAKKKISELEIAIELKEA